MSRPTPVINLSQKQDKELRKIARSREVAYSLLQRVQIVLSAAEGNNNKTIAEKMGLCEETVGLWRKRWLEGSVELEGLANKPKKLRLLIEEMLSDRARSGTPGKFTPEQLCRVMGLACESPPEHISHWSHADLAREVIKRNIVEKISSGSIGRFLKSGGPETTPA